LPYYSGSISDGFEKIHILIIYNMDNFCTLHHLLSIIWPKNSFLEYSVFTCKYGII